MGGVAGVVVVLLCLNTTYMTGSLRIRGSWLTRRVVQMYEQRVVISPLFAPSHTVGLFFAARP